MKTVTQTILYRQALIKYSEKYGVTKAAIRYKTNRQYIYRWKNRYDGTLESLADRSHRPHHHPNEHTADELKLIADMRKRNANAGLVVFWVKLRQRGYTRSITGLYRLLRRQGKLVVKPPNPKYIAKPYEKMQYPGQRVQIDVKFVPSAWVMSRVMRKIDFGIWQKSITGGGLTAPWLLFSRQGAKGQGRRYAARLALDAL